MKLRNRGKGRGRGTAHSETPPARGPCSAAAGSLLVPPGPGRALCVRTRPAPPARPRQRNRGTGRGLRPFPDGKVRFLEWRIRDAEAGRDGGRVPAFARAPRFLPRGAPFIRPPPPLRRASARACRRVTEAVSPQRPPTSSPLPCSLAILEDKEPARECLTDKVSLTNTAPNIAGLQQPEGIVPGASSRGRPGLLSAEPDCPRRNVGQDPHCERGIRSSPGLSRCVSPRVSMSF